MSASDDELDGGSPGEVSGLAFDGDEFPSAPSVPPAPTLTVSAVSGEPPVSDPGCDGTCVWDCPSDDGFVPATSGPR
ncbi:hypothetical protein, partial [Saccharopolyspora karakumensis]|uniref:hypothetical protein n=1 Tax=Saccharopolyspora karakumensis TaxID=2530386 RepID=UPI001A9FC8A3